MEFITNETKLNLEKMTVDMIYERFNDNEIAAKEMNISVLLQRAFKKYGRRVAIADGDTKVTYGELDAFSGRVANYVISNGLATPYILVKAVRDWKTVGIIMGILKVGSAYVPVQKEIPPKRLKMIQEQTKSEVLLGSDMSFDDYDSTAAWSKVKAEQCAYVIFTSGSTGVPKGVQIPHVSLAQTVQSVNRIFGMNEYDAVLGISELTFDLSIFDLFSTLTVGAKLVIIESNTNPALMYEAIQRNGVTTMNAVPAIIKMLLAFVKGVEGSFAKMKNMRTIVMSGDVVPKSTVDIILSEWKWVNMHIMGGPTEITVWSNDYLYKSGAHEFDYVPYGSSISNKTMYIMKNW